MTIDSESGRLTWSASLGDQGKDFGIKVKVTDGECKAEGNLLVHVAQTSDITTTNRAEDIIIDDANAEDAVLGS